MKELVNFRLKPETRSHIEEVARLNRMSVGKVLEFLADFMASNQNTLMTEITNKQVFRFAFAVHQLELISRYKEYLTENEIEEIKQLVAKINEKVILHVEGL